MNTVILTKVDIKSINDVSLPAKTSNNLRGDAIRLGSVYVFSVTHNEIMETLFSREELHYNDLFPVQGCLVGASNRTNLRVHFAHCHAQDTIVILE